jgi:hypothetical protein
VIFYAWFEEFGPTCSHEFDVKHASAAAVELAKRQFDTHDAVPDCPVLVMQKGSKSTVLFEVKITMTARELK